MQHEPLTRKLNVLILDDDPSIVRLLTRIIEKRLGDTMSVQGVTMPDEAREWLDENSCDVLISDLEMPGTDGLEMLRFTKGRNAWTQVVFITAHSTWDKIAEAVEIGASDYLLKPIDADELVALLKQLYIRFVRWQSAVMGTLQVADTEW